ncbi:MAG TPA: GAF domain-containing protein, partial [Burkholderiales bacterium]|nr:GAF domain-containing protein [Burkholderiales bacterium]
MATKRKDKSASPARAFASEVFDLAWAGHHSQAIELATRELDASALAPEPRLALLDLRSESSLALGETDAAVADAGRMWDIAKASGDAALIAKARSRQAAVEMRRGRFKAAIKYAKGALAAAERSGQERVEADALFRLGEARARAHVDLPAAAENCLLAVRKFEAAGDEVGRGRAYWGLSVVRHSQARHAQQRETAAAALAIARRCGDVYGMGNALNTMPFHEPDMALALNLFNQALAAFRACGYVERQSAVMHNMAIRYARLGLYSRAVRLERECAPIWLRTDIDAYRITKLVEGLIQVEAGHLDAARDSFAEMVRAGSKGPGNYTSQAQMALARGDAKAAVRYLQRALKLARATGIAWSALYSQGWLGEAWLAAGEPAKALAASTSATRLHRAHGYAWPSGMQTPPQLWLTHSKALRANGRERAADAALDRAYGFLSDILGHMSDEGLRRSCLCHPPSNRELIAAWFELSERRGQAKGSAPHLRKRAASLRKPFERLVDTGLRMNELRSTAELKDFLIEETTELTGAERVLLVLDDEGQRDLAGSLLPRGESAEALLGEISGLLGEATRADAAILSFTPAKEAAVEQRSRLVAPLKAQRRLVGYLYADIDGTFGRFREADRDMLAMLAAQAAVALENVRRAEELEKEVAVRTAELRASNTALEQRANELAIINGVQSGLAAKVDIQGIFDLVGDRVCETFNVQTVAIGTLDRPTGLIHFRYVSARGERFYPPPQELRGFSARAMSTGQPLLVNNDLAARAAMLGSTSLSGQDQLSKSGIWVPLTVAGETRGIVSIQNTEGEDAFTESDVRLLATLAASLSVALENARLFDETQRLLKETEQRNAELAIINSVQEGLASKLDIDAIYTLVGDKIREIFAADTTYIALLDASTGTIFAPYYIDRGVRPDTLLTPTPAGAPKYTGAGLSGAVIEAGKPLLLCTMEEQVAHGGIPVPSKTGVADQNETFMGVPILRDGRACGLVSVQSYRRNAYDESQVKLLGTLVNSMTVALDNAHLFDETQRLFKESEQRAAELAIINTVQHALAAELSMQGIYDAVGNKIREIFPGAGVNIRIFEPEKNLVHCPFAIEDDGKRVEVESFPLRGLSAHVYRTGETLRVGDDIEDLQRKYPGATVLSGMKSAKSDLLVPLRGGGEVRGLIYLSDYEHENAFNDADVRLLETLASSMGAALENARLFVQTQRLLKETEQRNAELAIINNVQEGLASKLDIQAIFTLVGDKIREIFAADTTFIRYLEPGEKMIAAPYYIDRGARPAVPPVIPYLGDGLTGAIISSGKPLLLLNMAEQVALGGRSVLSPGQAEDLNRTFLGVPIFRGGKPYGVVSVQSYNEGAYDEDDLRLLTTLANSMGAALENAHLLDETQRLYRESEQRAAELAIINSVQEALAAELNLPGIYEAVGSKICEIFHHTDLHIRVFDAKSNFWHFPYCVRSGKRITIESVPNGAGFSAHVLRTRQTLVINENMSQALKDFGSHLL